MAIAVMQKIGISYVLMVHTKCSCAFERLQNSTVRQRRGLPPLQKGRFAGFMSCAT